MQQRAKSEFQKQKTRKTTYNKQNGFKLSFITLKIYF